MRITTIHRGIMFVILNEYAVMIFHSNQTKKKFNKYYHNVQIKYLIHFFLQ